jgi:hypothetical protein
VRHRSEHRAEPDRIGFELLLRRLVALDIRQTSNAITSETAVQRRAGQMRDGGLECVKAIVERKERMPAERDDDGLIGDRQAR